MMMNGDIHERGIPDIPLTSESPAPVETEGDKKVGALFDKIRKASLEKASLEKASLEKANLEKANLEKTGSEKEASVIEHEVKEITHETKTDKKIETIEQKNGLVETKEAPTAERCLQVIKKQDTKALSEIVNERGGFDAVKGAVAGIKDSKEQLSALTFLLKTVAAESNSEMVRDVFKMADAIDPDLSPLISEDAGDSFSTIEHIKYRIDNALDEGKTDEATGAVAEFIMDGTVQEVAKYLSQKAAAGSDKDLIAITKSAISLLPGKSQAEKDELAKELFMHMLEGAGIVSQATPLALQKLFLSLLKNKVDVQTVLDYALTQLTEGKGSEALQLRGFAQEQLEIATLAHAVNQGKSVGTALTKEDSIHAARQLLGLRETKPLEKPAVLRQVKALANKIREDNTQEIHRLVDSAGKDKVDLARLYRQVFDTVAATPGEHKGMATFWKAVVQAAAIEKNDYLLHALFDQYPHLASLGVEESVEQLFQEAIDDLKGKNGDSQTIAFMELVRGNVDEISKLPYEQHRLHPLQMFRLSLYAQRRLEQAGKRADVQHLGTTVTDLPRAVQLDFKNHEFTILSKGFGALQAQGTFKKVTDAIHVAGSGEATHMVRAVNKEGKVLDEQEIKWEEKYGDIKSITRYDKKGEIKTSFVQKPYQGSLEGVIPEPTAGQILDSLSQIGAKIQEMHSDNVVHGDLKKLNVLVNVNPEDGSLDIKVSDFGATHELTGEYRMYGTFAYIAPEVLGRDKNVEPLTSQSKAEEMYALGCLLYEMIAPPIVPWGANLELYYGNKDADAGQKAIDAQHLAFTNLQATKEDDAQYDLKILCSKLLNPNPDERLTIGEFVEAVNQLKGKANV